MFYSRTQYAGFSSQSQEEDLAGTSEVPAFIRTDSKARKYCRIDTLKPWHIKTLQPSVSHEPFHLHEIVSFHQKTTWVTLMRLTLFLCPQQCLLPVVLLPRDLQILRQAPHFFIQVRPQTSRTRMQVSLILEVKTEATLFQGTGIFCLFSCFCFIFLNWSWSLPSPQQFCGSMSARQSLYNLNGLIWMCSRFSK